MKVGDPVKYKNVNSLNVTGKVKAVKGKKWLLIDWSDGVNLSEHIDDLVFLDK